MPKPTTLDFTSHVSIFVDRLEIKHFAVVAPVCPASCIEPERRTSLCWLSCRSPSLQSKACWTLKAVPQRQWEADSATSIRSGGAAVQLEAPLSDAAFRALSSIISSLALLPSSFS